MAIMGVSCASPDVPGVVGVAVTERGREATTRARQRADSARWTLETAVFLFTVNIITMILLFEGIGTVVVGPVAFFGLVMVWIVGSRQGKKLYGQFYIEELLKYDKERDR